MIIRVRNKHILEIDDFQFRCCIGKNGLTNNKIEGDKCTPKGKFKLNRIFYRPDRILKFKSKIGKIKIKKNMGWCDDPKSKHYNQLIYISKKKIKCEKLYRKDGLYELLIPILYNTKKTIPGKGSAIFIHLTKNYKPTEGCVGLVKKDFFILLKLIDGKTKINIYS